MGYIITNGLSRAFLSFRARLAAIAFLTPISRFSCKKLFERNSLKKLRNYVSYGSCVKSKNQGVENVSRTFLSFRAQLAAIAFLKPIFRFLCKKLFRRNSLKKLKNYISYGSCGKNH